MTPEQYDNILYCDLLAKIRGYKKKLEYEALQMRRVGEMAMLGGRLTYAKKMPEGSEIWPITDEEIGKAIERQSDKGAVLDENEERRKRFINTVNRVKNDGKI